MRVPHRLMFAAAAFSMMSVPGLTQTTESTATESPAAQPASAATAATRLSAEELQNLVAPVALYPDTVLIQVLIAATAPMDVILADRLLSDNAGASAADLEAKIKAKHFDLSVEVLAIAFPDLIHRMADHIDWTEQVGDAMLTQSDDVLAAVQVMRSQAINSGALASTPEVKVTTDAKTEAVVIQPTNPEVVYVPQYDSTVVYSNPVGDALATGLIVFGTVALIDEIFDDDDDWNNYWGCRGCADWNGGTVIRNPDIDINVDGDVNFGNVNIGNDVKIGNDVNIGNDLERNVDGRWKPSAARSEAAASDLARRSGNATPAGLDRRATGSDALRGQLAQRGGVTDISQPGNRAGLQTRADVGALTQRTSKAGTVKAPGKKSAPKATAKPKATASGKAKRPKIAKTAPANRTKAASQRGASATQRSGTRRRR